MAVDLWRLAKRDEKEKENKQNKTKISCHDRQNLT